MQYIHKAKQAIWRSEKAVMPLLTVIFIETAMLVYILYSIPMPR